MRCWSHCGWRSTRTRPSHWVKIGGRIEKGFDFLGYHFSRDGLTVAKATIERFLERAARLYEQERERPEGPTRFGMYVPRWNGWAGSYSGSAKASRLNDSFPS